jgi:hypothetical protein
LKDGPSAERDIRSARLSIRNFNSIDGTRSWREKVQQIIRWSYVAVVASRNFDATSSWQNAASFDKIQSSSIFSVVHLLNDEYRIKRVASIGTDDSQMRLITTSSVVESNRFRRTFSCDRCVLLQDTTFFPLMESVATVLDTLINRDLCATRIP